MFSNFRNITPSNLTDEQIREVEIKLNRIFTPSEIHAIHNSTWLRKAVEFIKKRQNGALISLHNPLWPPEI